MYQMDIEEIKKYVPESNIKDDLSNTKVIDLLKNNK
ncbi:MAG: hypothetical protein IKF68_01925 [Erysipelotrichaceae bacterium]|nr:hypothetical protein [Erysipelotrichaceae bacterium]